MSQEENAVRFMQLNMLFQLSERWKKSMQEVVSIDKKYDLLGFIRLGYESFHLMGEKGIALEIEEYITQNGGVL